MTYRTRFAPSPTGPLHLGHAFSALLGQARAAQAGGTFLVRIEDLDTSRSRPHWEAQIHEDLGWLGLSYPRPVLRQSERLAAYTGAIEQLWARGLLYPCTCSRRDIEAAVSAPQEGNAAPRFGPDGRVYPGTCRHVPTGALPADGALRLNMARALDLAGPIAWTETATDPDTGARPLAAPESRASPDGRSRRMSTPREAMLTEVGDIAIRRPGMGAAYHLAVVVDDAHQGITEVVRGEDLQPATAIHVVLQRLLGLPTPSYHHHRLIRDADGKRLAKRDDARAIALYRAEGCTPQQVCAMVGLPCAPGASAQSGVINSVSASSSTDV